MYHELSEVPVQYKYTISVNTFKEHLSAIKDLGKQGISINKFISGFNEQSVVITFDDGYATDLLLALPILKEYGYSATFYVSTQNIGISEKWLTWDMIRKLLEEGMDVQVHGHTHKFLDTCTSEQLLDELRIPIKLFKENIGNTIEHLSLPGGRFNQHTIETAKKIGFKTISTSIPGPNYISTVNSLRILKRYTLHQGIGIEEFVKIIQNDRYYVFISNIKYLLKKYTKKILGNNLYQKLWLKVMKYYDQ